MRSRTILKVSLILSLGLCCIFQVKESVEKFISKKKATISAYRIQNSTIFPSVTICNTQPIKNESAFKNLYMGLANNSIYEAQEAWNQATFSLKELVTYTYVSINGTISECYTSDYTNFTSCINGILKVTPMPTLNKGMCFNFCLVNNATSLDALAFVTTKGMQDTIEPVAIVHPEGQQLAVSTMTWIGSPYEVKFISNSEIALSIIPQEYRYSHEDGSCDPNVTELQYFNCFKSHVQSKLFSKDFADLHCQESQQKFGNCTSALTWYFAEPGNGAVICKSKKENKCAHNLVYRAGKQILNDSAGLCKKSCIHQAFQISKSSLMMTSFDDEYSNNTQILMMYLTTTAVDVFEEYLLFDTNSIISSVGGSLGLFLSFSFLECFLTVFDYVKLCCHKN